MVASRVQSAFVHLLDTLMDRLTVTSTTLAEFQSSTTLLLFGVIFLNPWPTLSRLPVYNTMLSLMPEWGWGLSCLALGIWQSVVHARRHPKPRAIAAFFIGAFYGFLTVLLGMATRTTVTDSPMWGVPTYPVIPCLAVSGLVQVLVYLKLSLRAEERKGEGRHLVHA